MNEGTMMIRRDYPETVLEVVDETMRFKPPVLRAVQRFAESKPWRGLLDERKEKFKTLNRTLSDAYEIASPGLIFRHIDGNSSGGSHYVRSLHRITLVGKLSVVTFLHEFAHARGMNERDACRWSINLFRKCFPRQYARLIGRGHMLVTPTSVLCDNCGARRTEGK